MPEATIAVELTDVELRYLSIAASTVDVHCFSDDAKRQARLKLAWATRRLYTRGVTAGVKCSKEPTSE